MSTGDDPPRHDLGDLSETQSTPPISDPRVVAAQYRKQFDDVRPDQVGPYRILETLGEGGMGVVYLAEQTSPVHRRVALKIIKLGMDTRQTIARFEAESEALAMMNHPGVAKVFDAGVSDQGRPYFVMEYVPGIPITDYCDRQRLGMKERLELFMHVCHAVQHAHQKGIIHRDIKPSNVLVAVQDGAVVPKVIDFGVAKATQQKLTEATLFTEHGQLIGTPAYMSPEQAEMSALDVDTRTDIYSLGVLLYELLVGALPFDPKSLLMGGFAEIKRIIREVDPPKPSTRLSALRSEPRPPGSGPKPEHTPVPPVSDGAQQDSTTIARCRRMEPRTLMHTLRGDLDWITMKALEKDRTRRYDTADALAMDVRRHLNNEPVLAGPPGAGYRIRKFARRNRGPVAAGIVIVIVLVGGLVGTSYGLAQAVRAREAEAEQRTVAEEREAEARNAREEAELRSTELEQVAEFQASQLSEIDTELMGVRLRDGLVAKRRAALEAGGSDPESLEAGLQALESSLAGVNFTNVALESLDENIFERALGAIDKDFADQPLIQARLLQTVAGTLHDLGLLDRATGPQAEALQIRRRVLGDDHPSTLDSISNMGNQLEMQGKLGEAMPYRREALEGRRRVLGDDHPETLTSINKLGLLLWAQGKLAEAEPYYREALEGFRRVLGDDHPDTLGSIGNMGGLLQVQGKFSEAKPYYREALAGHRRVLGDDHPSTLTLIGNMGLLLEEQGKLAEAEPYYREALEGKRRVLGDDHPDTLLSINNMGALLQTQGKLAEVEPFYREALEGCRRVLGDDHPNTLGSINNLGLLLKEQGKLAEAEPYFREALEGFRRVLGDDHPNTLASIGNMGSLLKEQGKLAAEPYYREALETCRRVLGDDHPETLRSINNMGSLLRDLGRYAEAEPYFREALEVRRRVLGDDHPDTLGSINNMGALLRDFERYAEAEALGAEAVLRARKALPAAHWRTAVFLYHHARTLAKLERFAEGEAEMLEAHQTFLAAKGPDDKQTTMCVESLADLYDAWHTAEPDAGHDAKAAEWRAKLPGR